MVRKIILKVLVFITVALGTAFIVNKINNLSLDSVSKEMAEPVLPVVYCQYEGNTINRMQGYTQVMSTGLMRDGIIPLNSEYGVDILVDDASMYGSSFSYELRTIAGDSLIEYGDAILGESVQGFTKYEVRFRMDMQENQEYVLVFLINNSEGETARYYTRVVKLSQEFATEIVDYALAFHESTMIKYQNPEEGNLVYDSLKTTGEGTDDNLCHVDLTSSYDMVTWSGLNPMVVTPIVPSITEIDNEYAVVHLSYVAESTKDEVSYYYNVDEYYTAKYDKNNLTTELLAFDRYQESIINENCLSKSNNSINMGIADDEQIEYVVSENNKKMAFVKEGQLWYYDYNSSKLTSVFSFSQGNYNDIRTVNTNIDINIADMDEDGNIYFAVYGYMNRGDHEGENGISFYHFSSEDSVISEQFFVSCDEPFDVMKEEIGRFTYYDEAGYFYYLLDGSIFCVNLENGTQSPMVSGIPSDKYTVSKNRSIVAYPNSPITEEVTSIIIHNFETGEEFVETGADYDRFLQLGFVGNDLIYGVSKKDDIIIASDNEAIMPLYKLFIVKPDGEIIKEYSKTGIYIMNAQVQSDKIYLQRANKQNNFFVETEPDFMSYKEDSSASGMVNTYKYDAGALNQFHVVFPSNIYINENIKPILTKNREYDKYVELSIKTSINDDAFYVFNNSGYKGEYQSAGRAILAVNEEDAGLVVDSDGNTIYRSLEAISYNTVASEINEVSCSGIRDSMMTCAYMCIEYIGGDATVAQVLACESWEDAFEKYTYGVGMNVSGIDLQTALYFLDRDVPFAACIDDGRYVLVISYNSTHIRYYDPIEGGEIKVTRDAFEDSLSKQSNTIYTYTSQ